MPRFDKQDAEMSQVKLPNNFSFSAQRPDDLENSTYSLVTIVCDTSGSVYDFKDSLERCIQGVVKGCGKSPYKDSLLLRLVTFNGSVTEIHGFKALENCDLSGYSGFLNPGGLTALCDACYSALEATKSYAATLYQQDIDVNGLMVVITDGYDNDSKMTANSVGDSIKSIVRSEELESLKTIVIAVNTTVQGISQKIQEFQNEAGIDQYVDIGNLTEKEFARMEGFISKSISATSQALGTGGPSQSLAF